MIFSRVIINSMQRTVMWMKSRAISFVSKNCYDSSIYAAQLHRQFENVPDVSVAWVQLSMERSVVRNCVRARWNYTNCFVRKYDCDTSHKYTVTEEEYRLDERPDSIMLRQIFFVTAIIWICLSESEVRISVLTKQRNLIATNTMTRVNDCRRSMMTNDVNAFARVFPPL